MGHSDTSSFSFFPASHRDGLLVLFYIGLSLILYDRIVLASEWRKTNKELAREGKPEVLEAEIMNQAT